MTRLVYGQDDAVTAWVVSRLPHVDDFGECSAIGIEQGGRMVGGVVYHEYLPSYSAIQMSIATETPRWASRRVLQAVLGYPFVQLGLRRVTAICPHKNERAISFNVRLGFKREGTMRFAFGDQHGVICGLLREDVPRWIGLDLRKVA